MIISVIKILFFMKIAMILPSLANKGPILVARDLCIEYKKMGHECSVFYFDDIFIMLKLS